MRRLFVCTAAMTLLAGSMGAQMNRPTAGPEIRVLYGALLPTGAQRNDFKSAELTGLAVAHEMSEFAHVLASVSWAHSRNKFAALDEKLTYIWLYDVGAELNTIHELSDDWYIRPFIGAGVGARTYDYKAASAGTRSCAAGYGSIGAEFQRYAGALRLDVRDNLNCFESPVTGRKSTVNDVALSVGIVFHIR